MYSLLVVEFSFLLFRRCAVLRDVDLVLDWDVG
jgi:hypothetical protein